MFVEFKYMSVSCRNALPSEDNEAVYVGHRKSCTTQLIAGREL
jgi:hypothetical protein